MTDRTAGHRSPILRGVRITRQRIVEALRWFDSQYPDTNDYRSWLENRVYKYALRYEGRLYPPKLIVRVARGRDQPFVAAEALRVLRQLEFEVIDKPAVWMGQGKERT